MNPLAYLTSWQRARRGRQTLALYRGVHRIPMNDIERARMWRDARRAGVVVRLAPRWFA